jgi:hypothetical protein
MWLTTQKKTPGFGGRSFIHEENSRRNRWDNMEKEAGKQNLQP